MQFRDSALLTPSQRWRAPPNDHIADAWIRVRIGVARRGWHEGDVDMGGAFWGVLSRDTLWNTPTRPQNATKTGGVPRRMTTPPTAIHSARSRINDDFRTSAKSLLERSQSLPKVCAGLARRDPWRRHRADFRLFWPPDDGSPWIASDVGHLNVRLLY